MKNNRYVRNVLLLGLLLCWAAWPEALKAGIVNGMTDQEALQLGEQFGVIVGEVDEEIQKTLGLQRAEGVVVFEVLGGKPAELAGIKVGSIIKEIDKVEIRSLVDFGQALKAALKSENFTVATYEPADPESQGISGGINFHFVRIEKV